jgi:dephospho-CoA kinase
MLIICGPSCVGKTTFGEFAAERGVTVIEGSDSVKGLFQKYRIQGEDVISFCLRWYKETGKDVFAKATVEKLRSQNLDLDRIVFLGCRTAEEVAYLRKCARSVAIVGIHADTSIRFRRSSVRDRPDKAKTLRDFVKQDMRELDMGLARVLRAIDRFIVNEGSMDNFASLTEHELLTHFNHTHKQC